MNEYNHHRIISKFANGNKDIVNTLIEASDFSDDFRGVLNTEFSEIPVKTLEQKLAKIMLAMGDSAIEDLKKVFITTPTIIFNDIEAAKKSIENDPLYIELMSESLFFYYYFYYEIKVEKNNEGRGTINLIRKNKNANLKPTASNPEKFLYKEGFHLNKNDLGKNAEGFKEDPKNRSEYFTTLKRYFTAINGSERYFLEGFGEGSNQSNCVAFLHAMGAQTQTKQSYEGKNAPQVQFENHLRKCFAEYLFVKDDKEALFMLGIAFHGIMDSFTPSHTDFQVYTNQDMGLHAQGDVLPIQDGKDKMEFIPGQYNEEKKQIMTILARIIKGYDSDEFLNEREKKMLFIFLIISKVAYKNGKELDNDEIHKLWGSFKDKPLSKINFELSNQYQYGSNAFYISNKLLETLNKVYEILKKGRNQITDFSSYLKAKKPLIKKAIEVWNMGYTKIHETDMIKYCSEYRFPTIKTTTGLGIADDTINKLTQQRPFGEVALEAAQDIGNKVGNKVQEAAQEIGKAVSEACPILNGNIPFL